jgi:PIN domain nuclease of toxin-antitoxin system
VILLDTHVWLWWISAPAKLTGAARSAVDGADQIGIASISAWEVAMLELRDRVSLDREVGRWVRQALAQPRVRELPLTAAVAVAAALLERDGFPGDPADRIIYATARETRSPLVTRDERLREHDPAGTVW